MMNVRLYALCGLTTYWEESMFISRLQDYNTLCANSIDFYENAYSSDTWSQMDIYSMCVLSIYATGELKIHK